jgi:glutamyl-tRNA reductase
MRTEEISRVLRGFDGFAPEQRELVEQFSRALINKIGHLPVSRLKSAPNTEKALHYQEILRDLFDLENSEKQ